MSTTTLSRNIADEARLTFETAAADDIDAVVALYKAAVGTPGCTWDDEYPSRETADIDLASDGLYVLRFDGRVIGAMSVVPENELDDMECFTVRNGAREFARITVASEFRGRGYAEYMLGHVTSDAKRTGVTAWHILVAIGNPSAIALYRTFGFAFLGQCDMYGNRYHICEKAL